MSFDLVNHKILRVFGGIEAQKNASVESLQKFQKKLFDAMKKAQACHKKIFSSMAETKEALMQLNDNYLYIVNERKHSGKMMIKVQYQINEMFQRIAEECLTLERKMEKKIETYFPNFKKIKEKYTDSADTLEHYKKKLNLLKKNVEKQSLAHLPQDEHIRLERVTTNRYQNKQKLRKAETDHDDILTKITKRYVQFNNQTLKDIYVDLISTMSTFGGFMIGVTSRLNKSIYDSFGTKEIILAQQLCKGQLCKGDAKGNILKEKHEGVNHEYKDQGSDSKTIFMQHLIESNQITHYLRVILDRDMAKMEASVQISDVFHKKQEQEEQDKIYEKFKNFANQYQDRRDVKASKEKQEQDPSEVCEDLIEGEDEELSATSQPKTVSDSEILQTEVLEDDTPTTRKSSEQTEALQNNLDKFQRICKEKQKQNQKTQTPNKAVFLPHFKDSLMQSNHKHSEKNQQTVTVHDFFNITEKTISKTSQQDKTQQNLSRLHEHPMNFDILPKSPQGSGFQSQVPESKKMFQNFDFFAVPFPGPSHQTTHAQSASKGDQSPKRESDFDLLNM